MSEKLFDALETCLQVLEQGETVDSALTRFPTLASELRPILETSLQARTVGGIAVPADAQRRGRARVLRRAAELREAKRAPRRSWLFSFRPAALTFMLAFFLFSGTGLVRAASSSLPGDNLYPVKRTWEDVRLIFVSDELGKEGLQLSFELERVEETNELIARGRTETVSFNGYVTINPDGSITVAGIPVIAGENVLLSSGPLTSGAPVRVTGQTNSNGVLVAENIESVPDGAVVPEVEGDDHSGSGGDSHTGSGSDSGSGKETNGNGPDLHGADVSTYKGIVEFIDGNNWIVNGVDVDVSGAIIDGLPLPGVEVIVEGYFSEDGVFIATHVTFLVEDDNVPSLNGNSNGNDDNDSDDSSSDGNDSDGNDNSNDNDDNDDDDNENDNENAPP